MNKPFSEGDRVLVNQYLSGDSRIYQFSALVLQTEHDSVLVLPEDHASSRWVGSDQLTLLRADGEK